MKLLLISNSTNAGEKYLEHAMPKIASFLGKNYKNGIFVPYAAVTFSFDDYEAKVNENFRTKGYSVKSIHHFKNIKEAFEEAEFIVVGGGNTFRLLQLMQDNGLIELIREKVIAGTPFIGWSAGSNVACPTIRTTNDMPIIEPDSFEALNLIPFQINPHYTDKTIQGHGGETRDDRIAEFIELNRDIYVVGLREGTALEITDNKIRLIGKNKAKIFKYNSEITELGEDDDFSFLLNEDR